MIRIWELHLKQSTRPNLPVILPLVLYRGLAVWKVGHRFRDLLEGAHESLFAYAPDFEYIVYDLSEYSDEDIKGGVMAKVMLLAMKYALREELPEKIVAMLDLLAGLADKKKGLQCLELLFRYLVQATEKLSRQDFEKALSSIPEGGDVMSTLAEEWFQEGMEKGRQEGKREGKREGRREGREEGKQEGRLSEAREVILELIEGQFGVPSQNLVQKLLQIQTHEVLRMLRRQLKGCRTIADFEELVEKAL
jgi:hypothetical protein